MRFESVADMPAGMRQKVVPRMLTDAREKLRQQGPMIIDGISFADGITAGRYLYLKEAWKIGLISGLRIRERITIQEPHLLPGGAKNAGIEMVADFSYIVAAFDYRDGFKAEDLTVWEAISDQAPGKRVFEFMRGMRPAERAWMNEKRVLWREITEE